MNNQFGEKFSYFFNSKKHILVVSFTGIAKKADLECFQHCSSEILKTQATNIIINLAGVKDFSNDVFLAFGQMQKTARENGKNIFICAISTPLRLALLERGIIRAPEIMPSLIEVLQKIISMEGK